MTYTISEAAKILHTAPSTIRYYDKEGLLPFVERSSGGVRIFKDEDFEWLFVIECLKKAGMPIKRIKAFIDMAIEGDETIGKRLKLVMEQRDAVSEQIKKLQQTLDILNYKCWYYQTAQTAGTTAVPRNMRTEDIPGELRAAHISLNRMNGREKG